jgi:hypothetical protein
MILGATYPAFVLSGFRPAQDLRLSLHRGSGAVVRKILVVGQFGIAAFLLAGSIVVRDQLMLMDQRDIGLDFNVEVIMVQNYQVWQRYPILRDMLLQDPRIEHVTGMKAPPVTRLPTGAESGLVAGTYWDQRWSRDRSGCSAGESTSSTHTGCISLPAARSRPSRTWNPYVCSTNPLWPRWVHRRHRTPLD